MARNPFEPPLAPLESPRRYGEPMRIEYRIGYFDNLRYQLIHAFMNPVANGFFLIIAASILASELSDNSLLGSLGMAAVFYVLMWIAQLIFTALYIFKTGQDAVLTDHVMEVRDDCLFAATRFNETRHFWPGISKVVQRPGFVAIYIAQHTAHVIPSRAFRSAADRDEFVRLIREKMGAA